jgi:peptide/nickel transport system substrate-binding protein
LIGVGNYNIQKIDLNGEFLKTVQIVSNTNKFDNETYIFYPTVEALKVALALGEITKVAAVSDLQLHTIHFGKNDNLSTDKKVNNQTLVTLFYNTQDPFLSDKKIRNGLTYALPDVFPEGLRAYNPYPTHSKFYNTDTAERKQDINHAILLVSSALEQASPSAKPKIQITSLLKYKPTAEIIAKSWEKLGLQVIIETTESIPDRFQIYLGDFNVPKDPDQYSLWHSAQGNNISKLKNLRIDKLLEDGRKTIDINERIKIYNDFQKYLLDESPAAFLYFPYEYEITRK